MNNFILEHNHLPDHLTRVILYIINECYNIMFKFFIIYIIYTKIHIGQRPVALI